MVLILNNWEMGASLSCVVVVESVQRILYKYIASEQKKLSESDNNLHAKARSIISTTLNSETSDHDHVNYLKSGCDHLSLPSPGRRILLNLIPKAFPPKNPFLLK